MDDDKGLLDYVKEYKWYVIAGAVAVVVLVALF